LEDAEIGIQIEEEKESVKAIISRANTQKQQRASKLEQQKLARADT
jgi:hypothetical protein